MQHVMEFVRMTRLAVIYYASTAVRPRLRDSVLMQYFPPQTATTMLMSTSAVQLQTMNQTAKYPNVPGRCKHPSGLRSYGAAGLCIRICDQCGSRWMVGSGNDPGLIHATPKAHPTAKTPLFSKGSDLGKIVSDRMAKARASNPNLGSSARGSSGYSQRSLLPTGHRNPEQRTSMTSLRPKVKAQPRSQGAPTTWNHIPHWDQEDAGEMEMDDENQVWDPETGTWQVDPQDWYHRQGDFPDGQSQEEEEDLNCED